MAEPIGLTSFALQLAEFAMKVYTTTLNLRNNSKRCKTLGENCRLLSGVLSKYRISSDRQSDEYKILQKLKDVLRRCLRYIIRTSASRFSYNLWEILFVQEYEKLENDLTKYLSYFQLSVQIHTANASDDVKKITTENNSYINDVRRIIDDKLKQEDLTKIFIKDLKLETIENDPSKFRSVYKGQQVTVSEVSYQIPDNTISVEPGSDSFHSLRRSVVILQRLANLGSVHGCYGLYRQNGRVYVVTEYLPCGRGTLTEVLEKDELRGKTKQKVEIARDIAYTLAYIHASGIIHKSVCCDNVYMTEDLRPKVSNFVYGREVEERSNYIVTNSRYEPPEVLPPDAKEHTYLSDIWSYGVLLWQLQTERKPYSDDDDETAKRKIKNRQLFYMTNNESLTICSKFNKLILDCCAISLTERPSISDIIKVLDDILVDLTEQETVQNIQKGASNNNITTETPFNDPQEEEWTLTNAVAWHQKADEVMNTLSLLKSNNQTQPSGESNFVSQDNKQLEQQYWEYREKAFKCYQYCGSTTSDSRALYYTGLYLWRGYVRADEDEFDDNKAKKAMPYLQQASDLNNADAQYELATLYYKEYTKLLKQSAEQNNSKGMFEYGKYLIGMGKKDEALNLIKKAALAGNKRAQMWLNSKKN